MIYFYARAYQNILYSLNDLIFALFEKIGYATGVADT
jgi:hypothetical protein